MPTISLLQLARVCMTRSHEQLAKLVGPLNTALALADATTTGRAAMLISQCAHESAEFRCMEENLSYSAEAICRVWPHRFPTLDSAAPFAHNPEKLANRVYADRMGNGDEQSREGFTFRGRGALQITGHSAYLAAEKYLGLPLTAQPDLAALPEHAFAVAAWYWRMRGLNPHADRRDVAGCTRLINGGLTGLAQRESYYARAIAALASG